MHPFLRTVTVATLLAAGCTSGQSTPQVTDTTTTAPPSTIPALAGDPIDWNDRSSVDISLPGWHLTACEGDAPFLCASTPDGTIDGTIALLEYPSSVSSISREDVEADAEELYRVTEEDRKITCGSDVALEPDAVTPRTVGGNPGYRYGFRLRDAAGDVTERVVLHVVLAGSRRIVINTAFSEPSGCPGEDPERNEFPIGAFTSIDPYLDELVARSVLPVDTAPR